jgi:hypothetical protein
MGDREMFVSAGFYIVRTIPRPDYTDPRLIPDRVVTVSSCIGEFAPDTWCIEWSNDSEAERVATAKHFGLGEQQMYCLISEMTEAFDIEFGWPNVIWNIEFARSIAKSFLADTPDVRIIELGLQNEYIEAFCRGREPEQHAGFAPVGRQGIHQAILRMQPIERTDLSLGFEPLLSDDELSCSWLCNGLETAVAEDLQILPNDHGLIGTFEEAKAAVAYIGRDEVGAEPGLWLPWLIIDHSVEVPHVRT